MDLIKDYTIETTYIAVMVDQSLPYDGLYITNKTFSSQEQALDYAYKENKYAEWIILPKVNFYPNK